MSTRPSPSAPVPVVVVGGRSRSALHRAGVLGDGWLGIWASPERFAWNVPAGRPADVADALRPDVDAGCRTSNLLTHNP